MEAVLTNGVGYVALVTEFFHQNSIKVKDKCIRTEIVSPND